MSLPLIKAAAAVAAAVAAGYVAVGHSQNSAGGVSVAGPVCVTQTAQPGTTVTVTANVVNGGKAPAKIDLSTDPVVGQPVGPPYPDGGHPIPKAWVGVSGPYKVGAGATIRAPVTIHIPAGAHGRYGTMLYAINYGSATGIDHGKKVTIGFGGGAGVYLQMSVGVSPPPRAFCTGQRDSYWPWDPPLPVCKSGQVPLRGQQAVCRVLPLPPPVANRRNCHYTRAQWAQVMQMMGHGTDQYGRPMWQDIWCVVNGRILNTASYYRRTGMYRFAGAHQSGPVLGARPANNPDSWRTAGSS
jgi:hypothetical protein